MSAVTTGVVVSIVTGKAPDMGLTLPATSVASAVKFWTPLARAAVVIDQLPVAVATALPTAVAPSNKVTALPASAVPVKVGVVSLVTLSVLDTPLSEAAVRSGVVGAAGGV